MPATDRKVWMNRIVKACLFIAFVVASYYGYRRCDDYCEKHPSPPGPSEDDQQRGAEREAFEALHSLSPERQYAIRCVSSNTRKSNGCDTPELFNCLGSADGLHVSLVCKNGFCPACHGCDRITVVHATQFPARAP
jgi:hypothetical protein